MFACRNCGQPAPEGARFCPSCGAPLLDDPAESLGELRKVVTVLFCDLKGSTNVGERLDSESLRRLMGSYFASMAAVLRRHGGTVEKFIGDAIMAVFGIPELREDDALRAVRAAVEMRSALSELNDGLEARWGVRLQVRTGINTGEVIAGDPSAGHGFVTGDAVNVAARLEQAASPDEILIGARTHQLVRDAVEVVPVDPLELKGKSQPVPAYRLIEVRADTPGTVRRLDSPLVGRDDELSRLRGAHDTAMTERRCALVAVVGEAGVGKSRLLAEFATSTADDVLVVMGRCLPYGEAITFWPIVEVVRGASGITADDSVQVARAKLAAVVAETEEPDAVVQRVGGVLGLEDAASSPAETSWALRSFFEAAAARRPLVLIFDDAHWGEEPFLDFLQYMAASSRSVPISMVVLARTELLESRPAFAQVGDLLALAPLEPAQTRSLVSNLLGGGDVAPEVSEQVAGIANGNALFVEELLRMLVEEGHLSYREGRWSPVSELPFTSTPPAIQSLIAARLDRLPRAEREVLERASVIGREFWPGAVRRLSPEPARAALDERLAALVDKQLLIAAGPRFGGEDPFAFTHSLVRDVAYQEMLKATRADLHERFAAWLEETAGERAVEYQEILGHHLEQAYRYLVELQSADRHSQDIAGRAATHLSSAGGRALARGDMAAAVNLLERASSLLGEEDPSRRDVALKLGIALAGTGQLSRVTNLLAERMEVEQRGRAFLLYQDPAGRQRTLYLDEDRPSLAVGRRPDADVSLFWDTQVSRRHSELRRRGDDWYLDDQGSRNGSFLNGERIAGARILTDGDVLRFGDTVMLFRRPVFSQAPAGAPARADGETTFGNSPLAAIELSEFEQRVLAELRARADQPMASGTRSEAEIAERLSVGEDEVSAAVSALELKFGIEGPSEERRRERLLVRAVSGGLVA